MYTLLRHRIHRTLKPYRLNLRGLNLKITQLNLLIDLVIKWKLVTIFKCIIIVGSLIVYFHPSAIVTRDVVVTIHFGDFAVDVDVVECVVVVDWTVQLDIRAGFAG